MEPTYATFRQENYNEFCDFSLRIKDNKELASTITDNAFNSLEQQWDTLPSNERSRFLITTIYKAWQQHYEDIRKELLEITLRITLR